MWPPAVMYAVIKASKDARASARVRGLFGTKSASLVAKFGSASLLCSSTATVDALRCSVIPFATRFDLLGGMTLLVVVFILRGTSMIKVKDEYVRRMKITNRKHQAHTGYVQPTHLAKINKSFCPLV